MLYNQTEPSCGPLQKRCSAKHGFALHVQNVSSLRCYLQGWSPKTPVCCQQRAHLSTPEAVLTRVGVDVHPNSPSYGNAESTAPSSSQ